MSQTVASDDRERTECLMVQIQVAVLITERRDEIMTWTLNEIETHNIKPHHAAVDLTVRSEELNKCSLLKDEDLFDSSYFTVGESYF